MSDETGNDAAAAAPTPGGACMCYEGWEGVVLAAVAATLLFHPRRTWFRLALTLPVLALTFLAVREYRWFPYALGPVDMSDRCDEYWDCSLMRALGLDPPSSWPYVGLVLSHVTSPPGLLALTVLVTLMWSGASPRRQAALLSANNVSWADVSTRSKCVADD